MTQSSNTVFKAPLLISGAFCKHQLVRAVNGVAAVDSWKQLKENTPKVIMAHFSNSNGPSVARERLQTEGEKLSLMPWRHFQALVACGHDCSLGENSCLFCVSVLDFPEVPELCVRQRYPGSVSRVNDSCWLLQACRSASCCGEAEMEKPQLLLAGSCQELAGSCLQ